MHLFPAFGRAHVKDHLATERGKLDVTGGCAAGDVQVGGPAGRARGCVEISWTGSAGSGLSRCGVTATGRRPTRLAVSCMRHYLSFPLSGEEFLGRINKVQK
eukprot:Hpha_TRINITY_DN1897_c0_g1::TRINITY_DN1897_c0_g1_i1::g.170490::m.170490